VTTVVLTGATRGIGLAAAEEFSRRGSDLVLVGRDRERVRHAAQRARSAGAADVHEYCADLSRLDDVRSLAKRLRDDLPRIDVLANNAGAMFTSRRITPDGFEQTFALNHLAPFLLTWLLVERLAGGRVVTTASDAHRQARVDLTDLQSKHGRFRPFAVYGTSKLCNVLFTRELQRRHPELTATCFHPGVIRTGFGKNDGLLVRLSLTLAAPFLKPPSAGAATLVRLAWDPSAQTLGGCYLEKGQPVAPSRQAQDDELAAALWERSVQLTEAALAD
jgi:NAD(P)-dependent dehydrogenase (short-subunit alcohol dehydrogenase family)